MYTNNIPIDIFLDLSKAFDTIDHRDSPWLDDGIRFNKTQTDAILLDFAKAFDKVPPSF